MNISQAATVVGVGVAGIYAGMKLKTYLDERKEYKVYEDRLFHVVEDVRHLNTIWEAASEIVRKGLKTRYNSIMRRIEEEAHRPTLIEYLRSDIETLIVDLKSRIE